MKKDLKLVLLAVIITAALLGIAFGFNIKKEKVNSGQTSEYIQGMGQVYSTGEVHEVAYWYGIRLFPIN